LRFPQWKRLAREAHAWECSGSEKNARAWREQFLEENGLPNSEADLLPDKSVTIPLNFGDSLNGQSASLISLFAITIDISPLNGGSPTEGTLSSQKPS
jgi:hypothetical protein